MSKKDFNESFVSKHVAPACGVTGSTDFPFEMLYEKIADGSEQDFQEALAKMDYESLSVALAAILDWLLHVNLKDKRALKFIGLRTIALAWVIDPKRFGNATGAMLAQRLSFTPKHISELTAEASRRFGITNKFQDHNKRFRQEKKPESKPINN